jgi:glycosyltransferase involved in cell wall biosynthesis
MIEKLKLPSISTPMLNDLPSPPAGKNGWPWTEETLGVSVASSPSISIVMPNFNGAEFIEESIRSILLQGYSSLELIVVDGGSNDESLEIINKYLPWIDHLISEPDDGQADAILKGLDLCTGEVFNWINSDDVLCSGSLQVVGDNWGRNNSVVGNVLNFYGISEKLITNQNLKMHALLLGDGRFVFHQPGIFLNTEAVRSIRFPKTMHYCFDLYLILYYFEIMGPPHYISQTLVKFRIHPSSKTSLNDIEFRSERITVLETLRDENIFIKYKKSIDKEIRIRKLQLKIDLALAATNENKLLNLIMILKQHKTIFLSRYWLGALKRCIF